MLPGRAQSPRAPGPELRQTDPRPRRSPRGQNHRRRRLHLLVDWRGLQRSGASAGGVYGPARAAGRRRQSRCAAPPPPERCPAMPLSDKQLTAAPVFCAAYEFSKKVIRHELLLSAARRATCRFRLPTKRVAVPRVRSSPDVRSPRTALPARAARSRPLPAQPAASRVAFRSPDTAQNLETKGIHEVAQRRFVLVAADHPLISAVRQAPCPVAPTRLFCCKMRHPARLFCCKMGRLTPFASARMRRSRRMPIACSWARFR